VAKDIRVTLEIDNQQYIAELKRAEQATKAFAQNTQSGAKGVEASLKNLDGNVKQLGQSFNKLKAVLGIAAFTAFAASAIQMGDAINDLSKSTGFSIAAIQNLRTALAISGGEADNAGNLLSKFGQSVDDLAQGNEKAISAFERVGVSMEDVATLSEQDLFKKTAEGLSRIQNPAERSAVAMDLMGKAAKGVSFDSEFITQMNSVSERSLAAASAIKTAGEFADQFKRSIEAIKESFLIAFEPLIRGLSYLLKALPDLTVAFQILGAVIVGLSVATGIGALAGGIRLAILLVTRLSGAMKGLPIIGGLIAGAGTAISMLTGVKRNEADDSGAESSKRILDLTKEQKKQLTDINEQYDRSIANTIKKIQLDTELIGKTDEQKEKIKALRDAEVEKDSIVEKLNQKRVQGNTILNAEIDRQIAQINSRFEETKANLITEIGLKQELMAAQKDLVRNVQAEFDLQQKIVDIQNRYLLETLVGIEKELKQIEIAEQKIMEAAMAKWEVENQGLKTTGEYARRKEEEYQKVKVIMDKSVNAQKEAARKANEQSRQFGTGWNKAFKEYVDNATNAARQAEEVFRTASRGIEDAIVRFVKTGKFEFKGLVQDILETILRSQIQQIIGSIFNIGGMGRPGGGGGGGFGIGDILGGIGGAIGGIGGVLGDVIGGIGDIFGGFFAKGGTLGAGKVGIAGESGPELITGPATVTPMSGTTNVHYHINAVDARSFKQLVSADPGFIHAVANFGAQSTPRRY